MATVCNSGQSSAAFAKQLPNILSRQRLANTAAGLGSAFLTEFLLRHVEND
ncbi:MAG: hypothetical protein M5U12_08700 [Verrucomicrobia bacterium]|nr:hypothetical protein [Verrucomicrobiota bacterium]